MGNFANELMAHWTIWSKMQQPQHTVEHASKRLAVLNSVRGQRLAKAREVSKRQRLAELQAEIEAEEQATVKQLQEEKEAAEDEGRVLHQRPAV